MAARTITCAIIASRANGDNICAKILEKRNQNRLWL